MRHAPVLPAPHVLTVQSARPAPDLTAWRATCAGCGERSPWCALLSEAVDAVWFTHAAAPLVA